MAFRSIAVSVLFLVILSGCGEDPGVIRAGGSGGAAGFGGMSGSGGIAGSAGSGGEGGAGGLGGTAGTGGVGSTAGSGGTGGVTGPCVTNNLCVSCPDQFLCDDNSDCFVGWRCIDSGCEENDGSPMGQCQPAAAGACNDDTDCLPSYDCLNVPGQGKRCVKSTPGCSSDFDCVLGFTCEEGGCVDRRMACIFDDDCPVSHSCETVTASNRFCVRVHQTCYEDFDCGIVAPHCADIDGDGEKECAGAPNTSSPACLNSGCSSPSAPVCEVSTVGSITSCGQYGLCLDNGDCASGFECLGLWPDGRKECVPTGGSCDYINECPERQVCASPRLGGAPSCQAGAVD